VGQGQSSHDRNDVTATERSTSIDWERLERFESWGRPTAPSARRRPRSA
jgi:hypothetical protein